MPTGTKRINGACNDPNEELVICARCERSCDRNFKIKYHENGKPQIIESTFMCLLPCLRNVCNCKVGYKRKNDVCIPENECLWIQVKEFQQYDFLYGKNDDGSFVVETLLLIASWTIRFWVFSYMFIFVTISIRNKFHQLDNSRDMKTLLVRNDYLFYYFCRFMVVPIFFIFTPTFISYFFPYISVNPGKVAQIYSKTALSFAPLLDPLLRLIFIREYRTVLPNIAATMIGREVRSIFSRSRISAALPASTPETVAAA